MKVNTKDLKVAEVRYYDVDHRGLEYTKPVSHVILLNRGDTYVNLLNPGEFSPIYKRVPSTTNACGTEDYFGTKIEQVCGEFVSGEAWLLSDIDFSGVFESAEVDIHDVEDYVILSSDFYHNRVDVIQQRLDREKISYREKRELVKIIEQDSILQGKMDEFFAVRGVQKVMQK